MKVFISVLVLLAACGPSGSIDDVVDIDADPLAPDAAASVDADLQQPDAPPGTPDAMVAVTPDAMPLPPIDWTGLHQVTFISGVSGCTGFSTPTQTQNVMSVPAFPDTAGYAYVDNGSGSMTLYWAFTFTWSGSNVTQIQMADCAGGGCSFSKWTPVQTGPKTWQGAFVRHETSPSNPSAPCDYNYTVMGTKL